MHSKRRKHSIFEIHESTNRQASYLKKKINQDLKHVGSLLIHELMSHEQILFKFFTFFQTKQKTDKKNPTQTQFRTEHTSCAIF